MIFSPRASDRNPNEEIYRGICGGAINLMRIGTQKVKCEIALTGRPNFEADWCKALKRAQATTKTDKCKMKNEKIRLLTLV